MPLFRFAVVLLLSLLLAACSGQPPPSRYPQAQDSAPLRAIGPEDVPDAIPRADPLLALGNKSPYTVNGVTYNILDSARNYRERGIASWYGSKFHGHQTSNGESFDVYAPSAAHRTLPIPSYARVTNLDNGKSVVVRVNDRGPFHPERLVDLSYGAAVKLGYMRQGTARVEVEALSIDGIQDSRDDPRGHYKYLQVGAFGAEAAALRLQGELQTLLAAPVIISEFNPGAGLLYRVRVGPVTNSAELLAVQQQLRDNGYDAGQPLP